MPEDADLRVPCARHPAVQTALRCGRCETPICPQCLVMTPVGARCAVCAPTMRNPLTSVSPLQYLKAIGAGLGVGALGGLIAPAIPFFSLFALMLAGWFGGEAVSRAANRKRGTGLVVVAAATTIIGMAFGWLVYLQGTLPLPPGLPLDARFAIALRAVLGTLLSFNGLFVLLAAVLAASRVR